MRCAGVARAHSAAASGSCPTVKLAMYERFIEGRSIPDDGTSLHL